MRGSQQLQTPQREEDRQTNRRSKSIPEHSKKPQKITKKCLNSIFTSTTDHLSLELPKDTIDLSSTSEVSDENQLRESDESFIIEPNPTVSPASEAIPKSDLTPLSSTVKDEARKLSVDRYVSRDSNCQKASSIEADIAVKHLKEARGQLLNSMDVDIQSKKLLNFIIKFVCEEIDDLTEETDCFTELFPKKFRLLFGILVIWIIVASAVVHFVSSGGRNSSYGPFPT